MSLDTRLEAARDDYRALTDDTPDPMVPVRPRPPRSGHWWVAAAVVVAVVGVAVGAALVGDDDAPVETAATSTTATTRPAADEPAPGGSDAVTLDPAGPYEEGDTVMLRVDPALEPDLVNGGGLLLCSVVAGPDGDVETCDPTQWGLVVAAPSPSEGTVRMPRTVWTPLGRRDCAAAEVTCRLVVLAGDGSRHATDVLEYTGAAAPRTGLTATPTGEPGAFTVTPDGLTPHPTWSDLQAEHPTLATDHAAFGVSQCAFGASLGPTPSPYSGDAWPDTLLPTADAACSALGEPFTIDPGTPDRPATITLPTILFSAAGWADCRVDQCYLEVTRTVVAEVSPEGNIAGTVESVATALLPRDAPWPDAAPPTLTVGTAGPHRGGQAVDVTVAGLPAGAPGSIVVCRVGEAFGCSMGPGSRGNGTHRITLPASVDGCLPESCYLGLQAGPRLPPLATAPLDTSG